MRLYGYCTECLRFKPVRVSTSSIARMSFDRSTVPTGICSSCEERDRRETR